VKAPSRLGVVHIALALFFVAIVAKAGQVQIVNGSAWRARAGRQQNATRDIPGPRGRVLDESGRIMAQNQEKVRLDVTPRAHLGTLALIVAVAALALGRMLLEPVAGAFAPQRLLVRPPRALLVLGAAALCTLLAEGSAADWSATYLAHSVRTTAAVAGLGYAMFALAMATSRTLGDRLNHRFGPVALVRAGGALAACGLTAALVANSVPVALVGFAAMGAGVGVQVPLLFRAGGSTPGMSPSIGVAAVSTIGWLGFLAGPPAIGLAAGAVGLRAALGIVVVALVTLVFLAPSASPRRGEEHATHPVPEIPTGAHAG